METLDWTGLASNVVPQSGKLLYEPNKHNFRRIAFDVFKMNGSPVESLWILEECDDGQEYLVAKYDDSDDENIESTGCWTALSDKRAKNVTLLYKDMPIQRFASADYGFNKEDVHIFQDVLVAKLNSDKALVQKLLRLQPEAKMKTIIGSFPELG